MHTIVLFLKMKIWLKANQKVLPCVLLPCVWCRRWWPWRTTTWLQPWRRCSRWLRTSSHHGRPLGRPWNNFLPLRRWVDDWPGCAAEAPTTKKPIKAHTFHQNNPVTTEVVTWNLLWQAHEDLAWYLETLPTAQEWKGNFRMTLIPRNWSKKARTVEMNASSSHFLFWLSSQMP